MMTGTPEEPGGKVPDACTCANHPNCLVPHQRRVLVASAEWRARTSECSVMLAPREVVGEPRPALIRSSSPGRYFRPMEHALAYIDPGSGSLVVQVAVATVLAIPFFLRNQLSRVARTLRGEPAQRPSPDDARPTQHPD